MTGQTATAPTRPTDTILDTIIAHKREELVHRQQARPLAVVQATAAATTPPQDFAAALQAPGVSLIAEIKRASPSQGAMRPGLNPVALADVYTGNGAAAMSVLTDTRFFDGSLHDLTAIRQVTTLPLLCKDFILDAYQLYEARAAGADAVLLIVVALTDVQLAALHELAVALGMAALVEVHNRDELDRALAVNPQIVGINNRDLRTFKVDLTTTARLRQAIPPDVLLVAESGIHTPDDVTYLTASGVDAMLVGTALVTAPDTAAQVRALVDAGQRRAPTTSSAGLHRTSEDCADD